ncbi:hypothetical protein VNI00_000796 [Paramarasmius palmivorus]|uniref:F-box domain-containing protein n=1 Tax=Paramarasmius palmivorus TaxID=297713 RepID=A0AAW0EBE9_9AGAR
MSPRHISYVRRYRISDDVLVSILEYLDPPSLWRACKAFKRLYQLMMGYQSLRYKYELAFLGMKDGPVTHARVSPLARLQFLTSYRKDWSRLTWAHETRAQIPHGTRAGASGGFLQQIRDHGGSATLELMELPSGRTSRPPASTRHLRYITTPVESMAVDQIQALVVTSHAFSLQGQVEGQVGIQLHFRDLWSFNKHPRARASSYEFSTQMTSRLRRVDIMVCGSKVAITHEFSGGRMKHLIINWYTFDARWLDDEDIQFLDETYLLGVNRKGGVPVVALYNISKASTITLLREFELPQSWDRSIIEFSPNNSPKIRLFLFSECAVLSRSRDANPRYQSKKAIQRTSFGFQLVVHQRVLL